MLRLRKLHSDYNVHDRIAALSYMQERNAAGEIVTGLLFVDPDPRDMHAHLNTVATPLNQLDEAALVPGAKALAALNSGLR
jgi:2-oxoglutarate ferredoxin oxidoreductase subunit beta